MNPTTTPSVSSTTELVDVVRALLARTDRRVVIGITGAPGAGKSTLACEVVEAVDPAGQAAVWVPMDGFHLADAELERLGRLDRKGAIETFDGWGYISLLARIRDERDHIVYAPAFDRSLEQPLAGAVPVRPDVRLVVTDGNYLLDDEAPWREVRGLLDEVWYCDLPDEERRRRLVGRHVQFGKSTEGARNWVADVDEPNARRVAAHRARADRLVFTGNPPAPEESA